MNERVLVVFLALSLAACTEEAVSTGSGLAGSGGQSAGAGGSKAGGGSAGTSSNQGGSGGGILGFSGAGQGGDNQGGSGPSGGSSGTAANCGLTTNNATCDACLDTSCCAQETACASNAQCLPLLQCVSACTSQSCADDCGAKFSGAVNAYNDLIGCFSGACGSSCGSSSGQGGSSSGQGGSSPGQGGSGVGGSPASDEDGQYCVDKINQYRATLGLPPLQRWFDAEKCSDDEALKDSQSGQAHGAFGQCGEFAQNECPGWPGPVKSMLDGCLQMMWDEGPGEDFQKHGHYLNMSSTKYSRVACGFAMTPQGDYWSVQNFQ